MPLLGFILAHEALKSTNMSKWHHIVILQIFFAQEKLKTKDMSQDTFCDNFFLLFRKKNMYKKS